MSRLSAAQLSWRSLLNMRQATTCTAAWSDHIVSESVVQCAASSCSCFSIWSMQVLQAKILLSAVCCSVGGTAYTDRFWAVLHSSQVLWLRSISRLSIVVIICFAAKIRKLNGRSEEHTSELQSRENLVCRLLLEKKKK